MPTDLAASGDGAELAGSLWVPDATPLGAVVMHPGSGPSDRHNDVYFPPIRSALLAAGIAVASFDKRGVGDSTGRWQDAGIDAQAGDAGAAFDVVRAALGDDVPLGLFGHSQGGWVVLDAAAAAADAGRRVAFVVLNSGPGVSPAEQERYSTAAGLLAAGAPADEVTTAVSRLDLLVDLMRRGVPFEGVDDVLRRDAATTAAELRSVMFVPDTPDAWTLASAIIDHDPRPGLPGLSCPVLALYGGDDRVVPVDASIAALRAGVSPELLTVEVVAGADHRIQIDDALAPGYVSTLTRFVVEACRGDQASGSGRPL